ncbi:hypothetical protein FGB62_1g022 [Gracilaria domingensis]|nr:hypothetical protein FGB62_1g022 [Gracilaria domingensis]
MADTVQAFRRAIQHIFPSILPLWLSAQGDLNTAVSDVATSSLERVLPTEGHRKKVFSRYGEELKTYSEETITRIGSSDHFLSEAKRVIAILRWLLLASQDVSSIASVVDAEPPPLILFAKGRKKKKESESALRDVCELAVFILSFMVRSSAEDCSRAAQFADVAVYAIRKTETSGWDLAIVLLRDGWSSSFGPRLEKLSAVVCESVASPVPTGVQALLPLFESLPHEQVSGVFGEKVLGSMREYLHPSKRSKRVQITVAYALTALLAYVQTASYSQRVLAARWFGNDEGEAIAFAKRIFEGHVVPTCRLFVSGILPPVSESISLRRKNTSTGSDKNIAEITHAFGHVLRVMDDTVSAQVILDIANGFGSSLSDHAPDERLRRFEYLVDTIRNEARENQLVEAGIIAIVKNDTVKPGIAGKALATLLSNKPGRRLAVSNEISASNNSALLSGMYEYCTSLISQANANGEEDSSINWKDIAGILSWIYTSSACLNGGQIWSMLVAEVRKMCSKETEYKLMTEVIVAQKQKRETFEDMGWIPLMGNDLDTMVVETVSGIMEHEMSEFAVCFASTALDVEGGARISRESWREVTLNIMEALRTDVAIEKSDPIIEAIISSFSSELRFDDIHRDFVSVSMTRAAQNRLILTQVTDFIEAYPFEDLPKLLDSMGSTLLPYMRQIQSPSHLSELAYSVSAIVSAFGKHGVNVSSLLCTRLLENATSGFVTVLLRSTPYQFIFGDGVTKRVNVEFFNEMIGKVCEEPHEEADNGLRTYLTELDGKERLRIGRNTARLLLSNPRKGGEKIICFLSGTTADSSSEEFAAISEELRRFWLIERDSTVPTSRDLSEIPVIVQICSVGSHGKCIEDFRSFLEYIMSVTLEDTITIDNTVWALETIAASLSGVIPSTHRQAEVEAPSWLQLTGLKALQSGRKTISSITDVRGKNSLEASLANLFRVLLLCSRFEALVSRELTSWASRICTVLQSFASKSSGELSWSDVHRLCFFLGLAYVIVNESEKGKLDCELGGELCYWGAWISVSLIPFFEEKIGEKIGTVDALTCSLWCGGLIIFAAETGTLLRGDGHMPVPVGNVYSLIPWLTSSSAIIRRAILTVVLHTATIDLSDHVKDAFPEEGFSDEGEERRFVEGVMPSQLREALEWSTLPSAQSETHEDVLSQEVGYLLAWRIFLDLMRPDYSLRSPSTATGIGDVSFRRVGLMFLNVHPEIYRTFFKRCVDIVVDGSTEELQYARRAAVMAIQTEENAASGVIVAKSGQSIGIESTAAGDATQDSLAGCNSEGEVGHAAGIVFARALQRLPALSREIVTHELERGAALRVEAFVRKNLAALLITAEVRKVKEWGGDSEGMAAEDDEGELSARGSVAGREVWATYRFSDVTLEIGMRIPDVFPLQTATVEARSKIGMSEAQWRKTLLGMATLLHTKNCSLAEALALWRRNLDKAFQGFEECPICYSVLHVLTAALPKKTCRTCKNNYHSDCLLRWFSTSNTSSCPTCRSAFYVSKGGF